MSIKSSKDELLMIQGQLEELKQKMKGKEEVLHSIKQADIKVLEEVEKADCVELRLKVEMLSREMMKRDFLLHSVQHQLSEKHAEIASMKLLLDGLQNEMQKRDHRTAEIENDLDDLRLEVATLRYESQNKLPAATIQEEEDRNVDKARLDYLAAVAAAKNRPVDDTIALAANLRIQLLRCLSTPPQGLP